MNNSHDKFDFQFGAKFGNSEEWFNEVVELQYVVECCWSGNGWVVTTCLVLSAGSHVTKYTLTSFLFSPW